MASPIYVLGTGLSHNGSAVLLKDGQVCVGIEKERLTRVKRDGGNDNAVIRYCLDAAGITLADVAVVVQSANFEVPPRDRYGGTRLLGDGPHPPLVSISHHLAHAWSVAGTCPAPACTILVVDGCGSPFEQCIDLDGALVLPDRTAPRRGWCEKDSLYRFDGHDVTALLKDFSPLASADGGMGAGALRLPTTRHSIGGFYAAISTYVFGNVDDAGKLMGLAPYGGPGTLSARAFGLDDGQLFVRDDWQASLDRPATGPDGFRADFGYYADVAWWAQREVERAVAVLFRDRLRRFPAPAVGYTGGVALNAVANARLLDDGIVGDLYIEPAAADNGLALGCAYHGWIKVLGHRRVPHDGNTCFGRRYTVEEVRQALAQAPADWEMVAGDPIERAADLLAEGKTLGWFQGGAEFGPRALGHRSILAHPGVPGLRDHINARIKFREDFRPFAPAVLPGFASTLFESGRDSPYMILVDRTRPAWLDRLANVTHVDGTARVQTIDPAWNPRFHRLVEAFGAATGLPALLNTSFNKRGQPIVETPAEAVALFAETALDALVMDDVLVVKRG